MPLRLAVSENAPINLPFAGQVQSSRSLSPLSAAVGGIADSGFASGFAEATGAFSDGVGVGVGVGDGVGFVAAALAAAISRSACSEYGSFSAFGADFRLSPGRAAA